MAREVWSFAVLIPHGTAKATPQVTALTIPTRQVDEIEVLVPPGPRGEVGFAFGAAGNPILPQNVGGFIISDNEVIHWPVEEQLDTGAWQLFAYNTGTYDHTLYIRFLVNLNPQPPAPPWQPLPPGALALPQVPGLPPFPDLTSGSLPPAPELPPVLQPFGPTLT